MNGNPATHTHSALAPAADEHSSKYWIMVAVVFSLLILTATFFYGFQYRIDGLGADTVATWFSTGSLLFIAGMLMLAIMMRGQPPALAQHRLQLPAVATGLTLTAIVSSLYFYGGPADLPAKPLIIGVIAATALLSGWRRGKPAIWFLAACGMVLFTYLALATPIDVKAANMLPLIAESCRSMAVGASPFGKSFPDVASGFMYYLPLNVLPYCPFQWSGIDPRWLNVSLFLVMLLIVARKFDFLARPEIIGLTFLPFLFSPMAMQMMYYGHIWPYWLLALLLALAFTDGRFGTAAVLLGVMLLTRQMALFVGAMIGVALIARLGWRSVLRYAFIAIGIFVLGMLATRFYSGEAPQNFFLGVKTNALIIHAATSNPLDQISISGTLVGLGLRDIMMPLQAVVAAILSLAFLRSGSLQRWQVAVLIGLGYMTVMSLSVFLHRYFYGSGLLLVASGLAVGLQAKTEAAGTSQVTLSS